MKIIIVDGLVGNDYSNCLALGLSSFCEKIYLVVPANREVGLTLGNIEVLKWSPTKDKTQTKINKIISYYKYLYKLLRLIFKVNQKVVHYQFFRRREDILFLFLLKIFRVKIIYTAHNIVPHERSKIDYFLYKTVYVIVDMIIVHSDFIKDKLVKTFKIPSRKVNVIQHGNFDIYLPKKEISQKEARLQLNLSEEDDIILFFGYIREYKGLDLLLESFPIALEINPKLKLIIAGSPASKDLLERYKGLIESIKCKENILIDFSYIPLEKIPFYFCASDLVALPYKHIDHSGIIHLAYSFAKPIVATNVGDFSEIIENGKSGFLVDKPNIENLSQSIISAFLNKENLVQMGLYGKRLNDTKYSWNQIGQLTTELYSKVIYR